MRSWRANRCDWQLGNDRKGWSIGDRRLVVLIAVLVILVVGCISLIARPKLTAASLHGDQTEAEPIEHSQGVACGVERR